jgi:hypothetical protein
MSRRSGARYPSGDLVRPSSSYHPIAIKRLIDAAVRRVSGAEWATPLGRMHLQGQLTVAEYGAGRRWGELRRDYLAAIGSNSPDPKSSVFEPKSAFEADPDSELGRKITKKQLETIKEFMAAVKVVRAQGAVGVIQQLCEGQGEALSRYEEYLAAKRGLRALAQHFAGNQ